MTWPLLRAFGRLLGSVRSDTSGQDLIEYALVSAALVVIVAAFLPPQLVPAISTVFSKISASLAGS